MNDEQPNEPAVELEPVDPPRPAPDEVEQRREYERQKKARYRARLKEKARLPPRPRPEGFGVKTKTSGSKPGERKGNAKGGGGRRQRVAAKKIQQLEAQGVMPVDAIVMVMRDFLAEYNEAMQNRPQDFGQEYRDWRDIVYDLRDRIATTAAKAAPYLHARLSAMKVQGEMNLAAVDVKSLSDHQLLSLVERFQTLFIAADGDEGSAGPAIEGSRAEEEEAG